MKRARVDLQGVSETALLTLSYRAAESGRPDALVRDPLARQLVDSIEYDFSRFENGGPEQVFAMMRTREFDRTARALLADQPDATIVDIGCGLDTRFERLDNGTVKWFGIDFPEVIAVRRQLLRDEGRCHCMAGSALDFTWMDVVARNSRPPHLFLTEGVFPYLGESDANTLVVELATRFPGAQFVLDGVSPLFLRLHNRQQLLKQLNLRLGWGLRDPRDFEKWGHGIRLLRTWTYFDEREPRLGLYSLLRYVPGIRSANWVATCRLGSAAASEDAPRSDVTWGL